MLRIPAPLAITALLLVGSPVAALAQPSATEPLDVTREFYKALHAGDAKAAAKLTATEGAEPALRSFVELSRAYRNLEAALAKRFGAEAAQEVGYGRKVQAEIKSLLGATVDVEGEAARVSAMDGHTISTLRQVGGVWRVELEEALASPDGREALGAQAKAATAASKKVVAAIRKGKYRTPRAAVQDFEARVSAAVGESGEGAQEKPVQLPDEGGAEL